MVTGCAGCRPVGRPVSCEEKHWHKWRSIRRKMSYHNGNQDCHETRYTLSLGQATLNALTTKHRNVTPFYRTTIRLCLFVWFTNAARTVANLGSPSKEHRSINHVRAVRSSRRIYLVCASQWSLHSFPVLHSGTFGPSPDVVTKPQ